MSDYIPTNSEIENDDSIPTSEFSINVEELNDNTSKITELSKTGYFLLKENKINDSKDAFMKILEIEENNNYALVGLGDLERKQSHFKEAVKYYTQCLTYHPGNNYALFGLADCYKAMNQYHNAIEIWEQYLTHDDRNITVLTRVADAYRKIKDFKKSKQLYLRVLDMDENNTYAIIGLGHLHYDFKEYSEALYYWTKMLNLNSDQVDIRVLTSIGNCHRKLKTFDKGIPFFEKALEIDPKNFYALFGMADCYRGMNQQYRSIEYWNKILEIDPKNKVILTRAGDAYRNTGNLELATEYYNKALNIEFDVYAVLGLALISKNQGKYDEAIASLTRLKQSDPKNYRFYLDLADCYLKAGQKNKAIEVLQEFQSFGIKNQTVNDVLESIKDNNA